VAPRLHHVVLAVAPDGIARTAQLFADLGFRFVTFDLPDVGLQVLLDWERGIELVSPLDGHDGPVRDFLARHGDGVYSLAIRVADAPDAEQIASRYGSQARFRQHRDGDGWALDEIELSVLGLPLTLLSTDLP
jgi:methylmalonyl-CoA/ethylmalonyl-CoA epimerase